MLTDDDKAIVARIINNRQLALLDAKIQALQAHLQTFKNCTESEMLARKGDVTDQLEIARAQRWHYEKAISDAAHARTVAETSARAERQRPH